MKEFNVDRFLNDILSRKSGANSYPPVETEMTIQADDSKFNSSVSAFLTIVFDYLVSKHGIAGTDYRNSYEINNFNSARGTGSDAVVMNEHGFMDSPPAPGDPGGSRPLEQAIYAVDPASNTYLYIVDEVLV